MAEPAYRFSQRVDNYIKYRPRYPDAVLDLLRAECQLQITHTIADIGSGTGLLSELFLRNGNSVFGVEPDPQMRSAGEYYLRDYRAFTSIAATAEATTLPDESVDFVTAGQAFHWFDLPLARLEFGRILRPDGWIVLVWNVQRAAGTPFLEALQTFWQDQRFSKFASRPAAEQMATVQALRLNRQRARQSLLEPLFGAGGYRESFFENPLTVDLQGLRGRVLSNGPALEPDDEQYGTMLATIDELFQAHQRNGTVTIEHDTWVVIGQLSVKGKS
jgi:SAM-dependent methyltransferase